MPLASDPEYMRKHRLKNNTNVYSRVGIKVKNYLSVDQALRVEKLVDKLINE